MSETLNLLSSINRPDARPSTDIQNSMRMFTDRRQMELVSQHQKTDVVDKIQSVGTVSDNSTRRQERDTHRSCSV